MEKYFPFCPPHVLPQKLLGQKGKNEKFCARKQAEQERVTWQQLRGRRPRPQFPIFPTSLSEKKGGKEGQRERKKIRFLLLCCCVVLLGPVNGTEAPTPPYKCEEWKKRRKGVDTPPTPSYFLYWCRQEKDLTNNIEENKKIGLNADSEAASEKLLFKKIRKTLANPTLPL